MRHTAMVCFALLASLSTVGAQLATADAMGQLKSLNVAGVDLDVRTGLLIPTAGWERQAGQGGATGVEIIQDGDLRTWTGQIEPEEGKPFGFLQTLRETQDAVELSVSVTADTEVEVGGVYLMADVSAADFSSGSCVLSKGEAPAGDVSLPAAWEKTQVLGGTEADLLQFRTADGATTLQVSPDRAVQVTLQDNREWGDAHYRAFFRLAPTLKLGETTSLTLTLRASAVPDQTPAGLTVDAQQVRYQFDGFGGNYCFGVESPVTQYTLKNLRVAWARTLMSLEEWEPENDNGSPVEVNWPMLVGRDRPDSKLRREFELAGQIQDMGSGASP